MASATSTPSIVVATSIPPNLVRYENGANIGQQYQCDCIESWTRAGFRILSLNFSDEIGGLTAQYSKVQFIEVSQHRDSMFGRKTPMLSDLITTLADQSEEIVGIINADICFSAGDWIAAIRAAVQRSIAVAHRYDINTRANRNIGTFHLPGYDLFFFPRKEIPENITGNFAIGMPWWDYMLPLTFRLRGLGVNLLTFPIALHLEHPRNFSWPIWRYMAKEFAEFVIQFSAERGAPVERDLLRVIKLCERVRAEPAAFEDLTRSLVERAWGKMLAGASPLPVLGRLARREHGQDANRERLLKACLAAISNSE
jgi:hypothetical protein